MSTITGIIIVALISVVLWLIGPQKDKWKEAAYYKGLEDGELKATNYDEFHKKMSDGHTPY